MIRHYRNVWESIRLRKLNCFSPFFIWIYNSYTSNMYTSNLKIDEKWLFAKYRNFRSYENMQIMELESELYEPISPFGWSVEEQMKVSLKKSLNMRIEKTPSFGDQQNELRLKKK